MTSSHKCILLLLASVIIMSSSLPAYSRSTDGLLTDQESSPGTVDGGLVADAEFRPGRLLGRMVAGLVVVLAVLFIVGKLIGRGLGLPAASGGYMSTVDTVSLGPGKGLLMVRVLNSYYLIAVSGDHINLLAELPGDDIIASSDDAASFSQMLGQSRFTAETSLKQTMRALTDQIGQLGKRTNIEFGDRKEDGDL